MKYGKGEKKTYGWMYQCIASRCSHDLGVMTLMRIRMKSFHHRMSYNKTFLVNGHLEAFKELINDTTLFFLLSLKPIKK